ncbi:unnamed protein product, partial [Symbiodinium pilosum]
SLGVGFASVCGPAHGRARAAVAHKGDQRDHTRGNTHCANGVAKVGGAKGDCSAALQVPLA